MLLEEQNSKRIIDDFSKSIKDVLQQLTSAEKQCRDLKETDRTLSHHYAKIIKKWFYSNGGM